MKKLGIYAICCLIFILSGYMYLSKNTAVTDEKLPKVAYYSEVPEESGILFVIDGRKTYVNLDFEANQMSVVFVGEDTDVADMGYTVDYTLEGDAELTKAIVDGIDGIVLNFGEPLNYTGTQVSDLLSLSDGDEDLKQTVKAIAAKIAEKGFSRSNLVSVIDNAKTDLTVPDCYNWCDYLSGICKNAVYVN